MTLTSAWNACARAARRGAARERLQAGSMERSVEIAVVVLMLVTGLSHVLRPAAWVAFFTMLRERGEAGIFVVALLHLLPAALIVGFHNRWGGIPTVLTVLGYLWTLKAAVYLTFPRVGLALLGRVSMRRAREFVMGGFVLLGVAGLLTYSIVIG